MSFGMPYSWPFAGALTMSASTKSSSVTYGVSLLLKYSGAVRAVGGQVAVPRWMCQSFTVELDEPLSRFW